MKLFLLATVTQEAGEKKVVCTGFKHLKKFMKTWCWGKHQASSKSALHVRSCFLDISFYCRGTWFTGNSSSHTMPVSPENGLWAQLCRSALCNWWCWWFHHLHAHRQQGLFWFDPKWFVGNSSKFASICFIAGLLFLMVSFRPAQIRYWSRYNLAPKLSGQVAGSGLVLHVTWSRAFWWEVPWKEAELQIHKLTHWHRLRV